MFARRHGKNKQKPHTLSLGTGGYMKTGVAIIWRAAAEKKQAKALYLIARHPRINDNRCCYNLARRRGKNKQKPYVSSLGAVG